MARPSVISWPTTDVAAICALQTTGAAGPLVINGTLSLPQPNSGPNPSYANLSQIYRDITFTSTGNLSGITFTIVGYGTTSVGAEVSTLTETIAGPNNNTVTTTQFFTTITSISANAAVTTAVSVGTGTQGFLNWLKYNYHASVYGLTAAINVTGTINYSLVGTLDDVTVTPAPFTFNPVATMVSATSSIVSPVGVMNFPYSGAGAPTYNAPLFVQVPMNYYTVFINSSNSSGGLVATFIQQGIT